MLNMENLEKFIKYLGDKIRFNNSAKGQRALMTPLLREKIKKRDKNTCQQCGVSVGDEPNLLIEIDHIIPISKGGTTTEDNLQALCWRCNRTKGAALSQAKISACE
ncbi:HNH endonuclease [compost metagenome]